MKEIEFDLIFCPINQACPNGPPYRIIFVERARRGEQGFVDFGSRKELDEMLEQIGIQQTTVNSGISMMENGRICNVLNVPVVEARAKRLGVLKRKELNFPQPLG
jgi:hypothetical protein